MTPDDRARRKAALAAAVTPVRRPRDRRVARADGAVFRCGACPVVSPSWAAAERHAHGEGHARIVCVGAVG